jgi:hypothetical protein
MITQYKVIRWLGIAILGLMVMCSFLRCTSYPIAPDVQSASSLEAGSQEMRFQAGLGWGSPLLITSFVPSVEGGVHLRYGITDRFEVQVPVHGSMMLTGYDLNYSIGGVNNEPLYFAGWLQADILGKYVIPNGRIKSELIQQTPELDTTADWMQPYFQLNTNVAFVFGTGISVVRHIRLTTPQPALNASIKMLVNFVSTKSILKQIHDQYYSTHISTKKKKQIILQRYVGLGYQTQLYPLFLASDHPYAFHHQWYALIGLESPPHQDPKKTYWTRKAFQFTFGITYNYWMDFGYLLGFTFSWGYGRGWRDQNNRNVEEPVET